MTFKEVFDDEFINAFCFFLAFGIFLALTSNLVWYKSILTGIMLFFYLIVPGYPLSRAFGMRGFARLGMAILLSLLAIIIPLYLLNTLTGMPVTLLAIIVDIIVVFALSIILERRLALEPNEAN